MEKELPKPSEVELPSGIPEKTESDPGIASNSAEIPVAEGELATEAIKKQPIVAFEHAARAAEDDKPIEIAYERRHEIKDEAEAQSAASIGSILDGMPVRKAEPTTSSPPPKEPPIVVNDEQSSISTQSPRSARRFGPAYRRAVFAGFIAALVLLVIWMLLQLIV